MRRRILHDTRPRRRLQGGLAVPGAHTRNGDHIEVHFRLVQRDAELTFGYRGGFEHGHVSLDFAQRRGTLATSDWRQAQPMCQSTFRLRRAATHILRLEKTEGAGVLVKTADLRAVLDEAEILRAEDLDLLPEMEVELRGHGVEVLRVVHRGVLASIPETFHVGAWQMPNLADVDANLQSLRRGLEAAAARGVELLVTPETSLTGLFPRHRVTQDARSVGAAERRLRRLIAATRGAPHVIVGLPVWRREGRRRVRYNVSRLYDPDGHIVSTHPKIHSCEPDFWHGYRLHELDVAGVPVSMHICHDGRYPEVWTLPVMFGARLVLHPSNGGTVSGSVDAFESDARGANRTTHAFHVRVNGGGGSFIAGPHKGQILLAVSHECRRDNPSFPAAGRPAECLLAAELPMREAYGYWPQRSFRASEEAAAAYLQLYRSLGGRRA